MALRQPSTTPQPPPVYRGSLAVSSSPTGAQVFLNGVLAGVTPLVLHDIPVGSRVVRIELDGHERWSAPTRIVANEEDATHRGAATSLKSAIGLDLSDGV